MDYFKYLNRPDEFKIQFLGRLQSDCKFMIESRTGDPALLWAHDIRDQIDLMRALYHSISAPYLHLLQINDSIITGDDLDMIRAAGLPF